MEGLVQCSANYVPLSPISFLERASIVYGDKVSIVYGKTWFSWRETDERCRKLASALSQLGITRGDIVAALAPNIPALYELHFGVPMVGAVLSALNTKLESTTLPSVLQQLEPKIIFVDYQFLDLVLQSFNILARTSFKLPKLVLIQDHDQETSSFMNGSTFHSLGYNGLIEMGKVDFKILRPIDECDPISVNYTSGSTGMPKGVVYSHRAAYLGSLSGIFRADMRPMPVFLWTVDMYRCNGWCFPWAVAALGGTNICLRDVSAQFIFDAIARHKVTHLCGSPSILNIIADGTPLTTCADKVRITVAGTLPHPRVLSRVEKLGFCVTHGYGMTEALGPVTTRSWSHECDPSHPDQYEDIEYCEGIHNLMMEGVDVKDPISMKSMPRDGRTIGEVMFKGNCMMLGYHKNFGATQEAFRGGWYRTGDLGVINQEGHLQIKDRKIDIINCGGERISTIEVEEVLISHRMVSEAGVVGRIDDQLGETPCAFLKLKEGCNVREEEIIRFCLDRLPPYMVPRTVVFGDLPMTTNGKIQKFVLRERVKAMDNLCT